MNHDEIILRSLAHEYNRMAMGDRNQENLRLHEAVNDLKMIRPVVLIDELPWHELDFPDELSLQCEDPHLREIERFLRTNLFKNRHMPADMVASPYIPVRKVIHSTGNGIRVEEDTLAADKGNHIVSHRYHDMLKAESDLAMLHAPVLTYDRDESMRRFELVGGILGDIIPVRLRGTDVFHVHTWDDIAMYRGVTELLVDLADRPEFSHAMVRKLTDIRLSELEQLESLGLLDRGAYDLHCTAARTRDLPEGLAGASSGNELTDKLVDGNSGKEAADRPDCSYGETAGYRSDGSSGKEAADRPDCGYGETAGNRSDGSSGKAMKSRPATRKDIWGRGTAQIFASVSKAMHDEFDIEYMLETIGTFGLAYYGCCEPLDRKIDIVSRIPNLRKISITPWADVDVAAEAIGGKYVLASKPNPASVAVPLLDKEALQKEIGRILDACRRNGCSCDIVLKDISTCAKRPQNLFEWERVVMDMVRNA